MESLCSTIKAKMLPSKSISFIWNNIQYRIPKPSSPSNKMRLFVTLCSLLVLASAKPQGYNYATGVSGGSTGGSGFGVGGSSGLGFGSGGSSALGGGSLGGGFGGQTAGFGGQTAGFGGSTGGFGGSIGGGFSGGAGLTGSSGAYSQQSQQSAEFEAPLVHKQFITIAAPEDNESLEQSKNLILGRPQKNYRVVFIKAPSTNSANVRLSAKFAPKEEKTVIYVLTKKDSALEVNDIATPAPTAPSKPEVFFIKYKTDAEAQHAQNQIQSEYDKIDGTSEHVDGGVAPQQSVVGILGGGNTGGAIGGAIGGGSTGFQGHASTGSANYQQAGTSSFQSGSTGSFQGIGGTAGKGQTYLPPSHRV